MGQGMTRSQFCDSIPPDEIDPEYRAGLKFAAMLSVALARDLVENNGYSGDVEPLYMFAAIARHLGSHTDA